MVSIMDISFTIVEIFGCRETGYKFKFKFPVFRDFRS